VWWPVVERHWRESGSRRAVIEQISADEAFRRLVSLSQSTNAKLREIASDLVAERTGPHEEV
jgi:hypothetical protein